ncbi:IS701 family transposase [Streptomyces sp. NPDC004284]|uniref:IS701 family transposase n=1 Tax=Streptomyces sp. NPDC004284 TaxID=3364695 RepID=UPI0036BFA3D2
MLNSSDIRRHGRVPGDSDGHLEEFVDRLFGDLPRADQRNRSREYVTGLLVTPGKKSLRRMAAAVSTSPYASQALQQFVNVSPWDWHPVRRALAEWVEERHPTFAWTLALAVAPKRGAHSAGVHRRFVPGPDRALNCQLGVGLFLSSADACVPVDWRLVLPGRWASDAGAREAVRIPKDEHTPAEGACALDLVRARAAGRRGVPVVVDLTQVPHDATLLADLAALGTGFVAQVPGTLLQPPGGPAAGHLVRCAAALPGFGSGVVPGARGRGHSRVRTCAVRLASGTSAASRRPLGLVMEHPADGNGTPRWLVTDLTHLGPGGVLKLAGTLDRSASAVREMEHDYGLLDFEGRSYPGWHHHMTLVSAAYAFRQPTGGGTHPGAELPARTKTARAA